MPPRHSHAHRRAFTLIEILIAMTLAALVTVGVLQFFIQTLNGYHQDGGKLQVNTEMRRLTNEFADNATYSNYFLIFPDFTTRSATQTVADPVTGATSSVTTDTSVNDGVSGDMLVLVFKDDVDPTKVARIVGYYRVPDASNEGPVRTFDLSFSPTTSAAIYTLLPATSTRDTNPQLVEKMKGLSSNKLFYNYYDRSVMINGQIIHTGRLGQRAASTYNFTVSPRG